VSRPRLRALRHGSRSSSAVALTFDDGPGAVTTAVLDALRAHGARATFNVLGSRVAGGEALLERAVREGHEIGAHGWSHDDHRRQPLRRARGVARTADAVLSVTGVRPRLFRPPYGFTNRRLQAAVALRGLRTLLWDVDPSDYEQPGAAAIVERVRAAIRPGSIVLLHDDRPELAPTAEAVDTLLHGFRRDGLQALTASELLAH